MRQLLCQVAWIAALVFAMLLGSCGGGPAKPQPGDEFVDRILQFSNEGACFTSREAVGVGVRSVQGLDFEAIQAMAIDGRVWVLSSGMPFQVAYVVGDVVAILPLRGRYREKLCYLPLTKIQELASASK